jgi:hypothetical protein
MALLMIFAILGLLSAVPTAAASWPKVGRSSIISTAKGFFPTSNPQVRITSATTMGRFAVVSFQNGQIEGRYFNSQLFIAGVRIRLAGRRLVA